MILLALVMIVLIGGGIWRFKNERYDDRVAGVGPKLKLTTMQVKEMNQENIIVDIGVHLSNTLPVTIKSDSLEYELFIDSVI